MMKTHTKDTPTKHEEDLRRQRDILAFRMKKLSSKQSDFNSKTAALKEKIKKKYDDMKRVLDEDLRITFSQLDIESEAMERTLEDGIENCYRLTQEIDQQLAELTAQMEEDECQGQEKMSEMKERIAETLKKTDPELIQLDEFKNEQLLGLTINLLLFIRSQVPVTKKLFQSYAQEVILDPNSAHPKLIISPEGDSVTYTDTWQEVSENPARFDTTLNVISRQGFTEVRSYWEVEVTGKTYWELGLTYPDIPRKGREEDCWLGRGPSSWCIEYFNDIYTAWHNGVPHLLTDVGGRCFKRIGIFSSTEGGLVCFLGADTMTPLYSFCAGTFTDLLFQALCPGHDNQGTNGKPLLICDPSKSAPIL
ncbi:probable E3 ubiquitin-protein ligase TRIML1 isoform X1 [Danio rerio]|uniref:Probable E3 ubiquitin-protein ligase TRIML1 isoform X1 n=2 Tax=Danio rerio TaxID=7955 RepID=E7EYE7_DANRE|nr:probable E3 ubiquitin-protein ligase TRIML1 isoform X1 [Danio rerio]|eukprot:XP_003199673.1 probable E3 ubiquitin-protein ligase TRIML1 isoform X1 [Danio rerio]